MDFSPGKWTANIQMYLVLVYSMSIVISLDEILYCYEILSILQFYADQQKLFVLLEKGDIYLY